MTMRENPALPAGTVSGDASVIVVHAYDVVETLIELVDELEMDAEGKNCPAEFADQSSTVRAPSHVLPPRHMLTLSIEMALAALA